jgi:hypothetical protein
MAKDGGLGGVVQLVAIILVIIGLLWFVSTLGALPPWGWFVTIGIIALIVVRVARKINE